MIHFSTPFDRNGNIGRYYNQFMQNIGDNDFGCFTDADAMFTTYGFGEQLYRITERYPECGLFVPTTNRIGCKWQRTGDWVNNDVADHRDFGKYLADNFYDVVEDVTEKADRQPFGGVLILISKATWKYIGGFSESGILTVDNKLHRAAKAVGEKVYLMKGVYLYHWYRGGDRMDKSGLMPPWPEYPRVAVITANVGGIDHTEPACDQDYPFQYLQYTEANLPYPFATLNNRMKSKYPKMQAHEFLPDFDAYIWIDGRVRITSEKFVSNYVALLKDCDVVATLHNVRTNLEDEFQYMLNGLRHSKYLQERYLNDPLKEELIFYRKQGLEYSLPLYSAGIFARWNRVPVNRMFDDWWEMCIRFGNYDQALFSYCQWKNNIRTKTMSYHNEFFEVMKHK